MWPIPRTHGCLRLQKTVAPKFFARTSHRNSRHSAETQPDDATSGNNLKRPRITPTRSAEFVLISDGLSRSLRPLARLFARPFAPRGREYSYVRHPGRASLPAATSARGCLGPCAQVKRTIAASVEQLRASGGPLIGRRTVRLAKHSDFATGWRAGPSISPTPRQVLRRPPTFHPGLYHPLRGQRTDRRAWIKISGQDRAKSTTSPRRTSSSCPPSGGRTTLARIKDMAANRDTPCGRRHECLERVRQNASTMCLDHPRNSHEETNATASRAVVSWQRHYLVVLRSPIRLRGTHSARRRTGCVMAKLPGLSEFDSRLDLPGRRGQPETRIRGEPRNCRALEARSATRTARAGAESFRFFDTIAARPRRRIAE